MVEYISKSDAVLAACRVLDKFGGCSMGLFCPDSGCREVREVVDSVPAADVVEVVRCKDCVHRPEASDGVTSGVRVEAPRDEEGWHDDTCPYLCGDPWYNEIPNDDWFCHLGERKGNG